MSPVRTSLAGAALPDGTVALPAQIVTICPPRCHTLPTSLVLSRSAVMVISGWPFLLAECPLRARRGPCHRAPAWIPGGLVLLRDERPHGQPVDRAQRPPPVQHPRVHPVDHAPAVAVIHIGPGPAADHRPSSHSAQRSPRTSTTFT